MTPEVQSHIFEKYYQGAAEDKKHGLGLGLSIVKYLVEAMGGSVSVHSVKASRSRGAAFPFICR